MRRVVGTVEYCDVSQSASLLYAALVLGTAGFGGGGEALGERLAMMGGWERVFVQAQPGL